MVIWMGYIKCEIVRKQTRPGIPGGFVSCLAVIVELLYSMFAALPHTGNRKGVEHMELAISFFVSVAASVVGYYISKWLDRHGKGS